jgi:hypothetical protein
MTLARVFVAELEQLRRRLEPHAESRSRGCMGPGRSRCGRRSRSFEDSGAAVAMHYLLIGKGGIKKPRRSGASSHGFLNCPRPRGLVRGAVDISSALAT